jgi:hypothetical protein
MALHLCLPRAAGVRGDVYHMIDLIKDSTIANHPSWALALPELKAVFHINHPGDFAAATRTGGEVPETAVRKFMPPPHEVLKRLTAWAKRWFKQGVDADGTSMFTVQTVQTLQHLMDHIIAWRFSGKCDKSLHHLRPRRCVITQYVTWQVHSDYTCGCILGRMPAHVLQHTLNGLDAVAFTACSLLALRPLAADL